MSISPDERYTLDDHSFRESDPYAKAKYELTLRWLPRRAGSGDVCYNIGVGSGYFNHLAAARGYHVIGCEPDPEAFELAKRTAPGGVDLVNSGLLDFAKGRKPAPLIVMHDVLEHIEDDHEAIKSLRSLLRDDGIAIVSVPALMSLYGLHDEQLGHFRRYTAASLRAVVETQFVVRRLRWYGMASIPIAWYFSRWRRQPYPLGSVKKSVLGQVYGAVCSLEGFLAEPIGTSLIVELAPHV